MMSTLTPASSRRLQIPRILLAALSALAFTVAVQAASTSKKNFSLPAGDAATTLKSFADQSGEQILYPAELVRGTKTNAVSGELSAREALDAMLANTGLVIVQDKESGALAVKKSGPENSTPPSTNTVAPTVQPVAVEGAKAVEDEEMLVLSPFEVRADNKGYYASSSLSGTRINSKIEDLAASISVITKQQIADTASLDINDLFKYEANTEGMAQYTDFTIDRTFYKETTTLSPQSANRIRGLGAANTAVNNFAVSDAIPLDTYNIDSVEISRGPNANIFGLGNASGTVNVNTSRASLFKNSSQLVMRADSYGGQRGSMNLSRVLWKDRAAIMVAALYDDKGFERKPAYETIKRVNAGFTAKPFKSTKVRGSFESYRNNFSRANTTLIRDSYTEWADNGMPVWNPTYTTGGATGAWRLLNSSTYNPVATASENTQLPLGLQPGGTGFWANPSVYIEPNGQVRFFGTNTVGSVTTTAPIINTPSTATGPIYRYVETGSIYRRGSNIGTTPATPLILFQPLSITDKSIYDYTSLNYLAPNFGRDKGETYQAELEQRILDTAVHKLTLQLGYYRERISQYGHNVFSTSDAGTPFLSVDINETLIDGTANPYFLRPYIGTSQPVLKYNNQVNSDARAALAYQLDLTDGKGFSKWLGHHNLVAYGERRDLLATSLSARDVNVTDYTTANGFNPAWTTGNDLTSIPGRSNVYRIYPRYYLGGPVTDAGSVVDYAPAGNYTLGDTPLTWFTPTTRVPVTQAASLQEVITSGNAKDREIRSQGVTWQGFFWKDRIVTTLGWRHDRNRERSSTSLNSSPTAAATTIDPNTRLNDLSVLKSFPNPWEQKSGTSRNAGIVFKATKWLNLNYSQSNSFKPEAIAYNVNAQALPNPTGKTTDYGFTLKFFDEKLVARITRYESEEKNSRNGSITSAAVTRTLRLFFDPAANNALELQTPTPAGLFSSGQDSFDLEQSAAQWYLQNNPGASAVTAQQYAVNTYLVPMGIDQEFINKVRAIGNNFTDVNTVTSKGVEFEISYNPSKYWTLKIAGAQQKAVDTELGTAVQDYINSRLEAMRAVIVPLTPTTAPLPAGNGTSGKQWWRMGSTSATATGVNTPAGFYVANVRSVIGLATANAGKPRAQTREYQFNATTDYSFEHLFRNAYLRRTSIGGSVRWASKSAVSYYGMPPSTDTEFNGAIIDYDPNRPIYDKARTYVDFKISHKLPLWTDKVHCKLQLNINNVFENGRLQPIAYNPDGKAWNYRIVDPRQFILTASFDL
jgi:hypothetical protein